MLSTQDIQALRVGHVPTELQSLFSFLSALVNEPGLVAVSVLHCRHATRH